ncbi:MAG: hypothetical protein Q8Q39_00795 [bacterium]|nr:hypothetical protein [bacterium]
MKHIKTILVSSYEKKERAQSALVGFFTAMEQVTKTNNKALASLAGAARIVSYEKEILTIEISRKKLSPEIHYYTEELRTILEKQAQKKITKLRIVPAA